MKEIKKYNGIIYNKEDFDRDKIDLYKPEITPSEYFTIYGKIQWKKANKLFEPISD